MSDPTVSCSRAAVERSRPEVALTGMADSAGQVLAPTCVRRQEGSARLAGSILAPALPPNEHVDIRTEVDFLLRRGREFVAIEVKAGRTYAPQPARGLKASSVRGIVRRILVYGGERVLRTADGVDVLPVGRFVREVESGTLFP